MPSGCAKELLKAGAVGLLVVAAPFLIVPIVTSPSLPQPLGWAAGIGLVAVVAVALWWFTRPHTYDQAKAMGMTVEHSFAATRCLQLEDWNDLGPNYLIELSSGECLYLGGQYIDDVDDGDVPRRRFPTSAFTVVRNRRQGFVYEIRSSGTPLAPEAMKQFFLSVKGVPAPEDGAILPAGSYEHFKRALPDGRPDNA